MTTTRETSTPIGDLFGGAVAPPVRGEVTPREFKRRYIPKTYSEVETRQAARVIAHWNQQFANVAGAFRANAGDAVNIKSYVKMLRSIEKAGDDFNYIDEAVVKQAITLYRTDPANLRITRWKRFSAWLTVESIDFYKSRIRIADNKRLHVAQTKAADADRAAKAREIATHRFVEIAIWAAKRKLSVLAFLRIPPPASIASTSPGVLEEREQWLVIAERREQLTAESREALSNGARTVFAEHFNRPIGTRPDEDQAILVGIEHALIALYPNDKRLKEQP